MARGKYETWLEPDNLLRLEAWARDGLTLAQIAHNVGVSESTLREWRNAHPAISAAIKRGADVVDIEVENALLKRATGFEYTENMTEYLPDGSVKTRVTVKTVVPDVGAAAFWLKNRRPDKWKDKPVDESESAALTEARKLLASVDSVIGGET